MKQQKLIAKNRGIIYRYPRLFVGTVTTVFMLTFFSKPIYDIFISDHIININELRKPDASSKK